MIDVFKPRIHVAASGEVVVDSEVVAVDRALRERLCTFLASNGHPVKRDTWMSFVAEGPEHPVVLTGPYGRECLRLEHDRAFINGHLTTNRYEIYAALARWADECGSVRFSEVTHHKPWSTSS